MIRFKEALQRLTLNFEVDEPLMKEWIVRVDREANAYTALPSTIKSMSQTRSVVLKTQASLRQLNNNSALNSTTVNNNDLAYNEKVNSSLQAKKAYFLQLRSNSNTEAKIRNDLQHLTQSIDVESKHGLLLSNTKGAAQPGVVSSALHTPTAARLLRTEADENDEMVGGSVEDADSEVTYMESPQ